jgi:hypothetical protein
MLTQRTNIMKKLWIILLAVTSGYGIATAQKPAVVMSDKTGWHKIGSTTVDFQKEQDEISVLGADRFAALKLRVDDAPVQIDDIEIYFEDNTMQRASIRTPLTAGAESRVIKIEGGEKDIARVSFIYKTVANGKNEKATVELWGMKTNTDESMSNRNDMNSRNDMNNKNDMNNRNTSDTYKNGKSTTGDTYKHNETTASGNSGKTAKTNGNMPPVSEWEKIGEAKVDFNRDRDEIHVGNDKYYSAVKFRVKEAAINLSDMEIYYENGRGKQVIPIGAIVKETGESRVIDLKGSSQDIDKIVFIYKTLDNKSNDKARVEVWGLRDYKEMGASTDEKN